MYECDSLSVLTGHLHCSKQLKDKGGFFWPKYQVYSTFVWQYIIEQHVFVTQRLARKAEVMRITKGHEGKPRVPSNECVAQFRPYREYCPECSEQP